MSQTPTHPAAAPASALLGKRFLLLSFPEEIEAKYQDIYNHRAALDFRYRSVVILLLYGILSTGVIGILPAERLMEWLFIYGWVGVIIVMAGILSHLRFLDGLFSFYVGFGSMLAVCLSVATATVIHGGQSGILSHAGIMYAIIIIYSFVGLRFYHAVLAGWLGGVLGVFLTIHLQGNLDWGLLHRTYSGTSLLGMSLAYAIDYRSRQTFIQSLALEEAQQQTIQQNRRLEALTREDALTGLANRRHLDHLLESEWGRGMRQQEPLALLMIDVDHFKHYNDQLGHPAGDVCLREVASAIQKMARRSGDAAARYGGEEFTLLYPSTNGSQALGLARQLNKSIEELRLAHPASTTCPVVTVSIGVAVMVPTLAHSYHELVAHADEALYQAKSQGRNQAQLYGHISQGDHEVIGATPTARPQHDQGADSSMSMAARTIQPH